MCVYRAYVFVFVYVCGCVCVCIELRQAQRENGAWCVYGKRVHIEASSIFESRLSNSWLPHSALRFSLCIDDISIEWVRSAAILKKYEYGAIVGLDFPICVDYDRSHENYITVFIELNRVRYRII